MDLPDPQIVYIDALDDLFSRYLHLANQDAADYWRKIWSIANAAPDIDERIKYKERILEQL